uniref:Uncharacterized protein n=1 Tax=Arundo donax TaxID=35708 RepID=A0A0A9IWS0_ARUDO
MLSVPTTLVLMVLTGLCL